MTYEIVPISSLDGFSLNTGAQQINEKISDRTCTGLLIGVQCLENGGTIPTAANIHTKIGTVEIVVSSKDSSGSQVSFDADDIPPLMEKMFRLPQPGIMGTQTDDRYIHYQYFLPLAPDPFDLKCPIGYRDARLKILTTGTQTASDTYALYVGAVLHDVKPKYYPQMIMNSDTGATNGKTDIDLPDGGKLLGAYAMGTTSLQDLTASDAATINDLAIVVDNTEMSRVSNRFLHAIQPTGIYMVAGTTVTSTAAIGGPEYLWWDLGWGATAKYGEVKGVDIKKDWKLRVKTNAADALRVYPIVALPVKQNV